MSTLDELLPALGDEVEAHVAARLVARKWEELEALEVEGRLLFPSKIRRRKQKGEFEEIPVMLQVPREPDVRWARVEARRLAQEANLDLDRDRDLVDNLETICTLSRCIRNASAPYEAWEPYPDALERTYDRDSLTAVWEEIDRHAVLLNPRPKEIGRGEMMAVIAAIVRERDIYPLAVYAPGAQVSCITYMADLAATYLVSKLSSGSSEG